MSREKQIEELTNELIRTHSYGTSNAVAEHLYNAGYRKQSVGEWKKVSDKSPRYKCTICNHLYNNMEYKYCPYCGAKMKGGAE